MATNPRQSTPSPEHDQAVPRGTRLSIIPALVLCLAACSNPTDQQTCIALARAGTLNKALYHCGTDGQIQPNISTSPQGSTR